MTTKFGKIMVMLTCGGMLGVATPADTFKLLIVHTNDMHSRFDQASKSSGVCSKEEADKNQCYGGFARVSTAVTLARERSSKAETKSLFLIAGDIYQGTNMYTFYKWPIVSRMTNMLKPDAMSLGNHEFDDGVNGLVPFIDNATFPILASNLDLSKQPDLNRPNLKKSVVFDLGGVKVAVIGYVTPETKLISQAEQVEFLEEVQSIKSEVGRLKATDPNLRIFIALGHSGFEMDQKIAADVPDIDVVVGGHTNTFLYSGNKPDSEDPEGIYPTFVTQTSGRRVPVVQAYAYTKYLGQLNLEFNSLGEITNAVGNPLLLDHNTEQDPSVVEELNKWKKNTTLLERVEIGKTKVVLDGDTVHCRVMECNLGNFIADAFMDYMARLHRLNHRKGWTDTPIAIQNSGSIRASIDARGNDGKVTMGDLVAVLPFVNNMVRMSLNGSDILDMLEWSVYDYNAHEHKGKFLQYSGLRVEYDLNKPNGKRVTKALAKRSYNVIMTVFLASGGDGFTMLKNNYRRQQVMDVTDIDMVKDFFIRRSPVYPGVEGRTQFVNNIKSAASKIRSFIILPLLASLVTAISAI
ncbi:protein 5NUC-like [Zootermopsis nevadensis]|uniref:protein 5NUC-like n=1 Tax=Zootermopsis nevadensis TaxID=136037 RepID=UPI000B8E392C|nr:protein 5NUC-like [Zootermopsis nevadensis]